MSWAGAVTRPGLPGSVGSVNAEPTDLCAGRGASLVLPRDPHREPARLLLHRADDPGAAAHRAVLDVGLRRTAARVHEDRDELAAVGALDLDVHGRCRYSPVVGKKPFNNPFEKLKARADAGKAKA